MPRDFFEDLSPGRQRDLQSARRFKGQQLLNDFFKDQQSLLRSTIGPGSAGLGANVRAGFAVSPVLERRIIARALFPDLPEEERELRVTFVNGRPVYVDDEGGLRYADTGILNRAGAFVGETGPEILGGIVGSILGSPILGGGLGAAAGEGTQRIISGAIEGEAESTGRFLRAVGTEFATDAAFGKLFQMAGMRLLGARARGARLDDLDPTDLAKAQDDILKRTGVRVDLAQLSERASLQNLRDWAARFPNEASDIMRALGDLQNEQTQRAAQRILDSTIRIGDRRTLGGRAVNAAREAINAAREARRQITKPLYEAAFNQDLVVDPSDVVARLDGMIADSKGPIRTTLRNASELFYTQVGDDVVLDTSVRGLHNTKRALDAFIEGVSETGRLSDETRFLLGSIRDDLVSTLNVSSDLYRQANEEFARASRILVDPLRQGPVGTVASLKPGREAMAGAKLFTGRDVTPADVRIAREAISRQSPEAWNGALRLFLGDAFDKAARETQGATVRNFAGKFRQAVFGSPRQRAVMREALGSDRLPLFEDVMEAFRMVSNLPIVGSNTARDQMISRGQENLLVGAVRFFRSLGMNVLDRMGEESAGRYARRVALAMSDPAKVSQLRELRNLSPSGERSLLILGIVFGETLEPEE